MYEMWLVPVNIQYNDEHLKGSEKECGESLNGNLLPQRFLH